MRAMRTHEYRVFAIQAKGTFARDTRVEQTDVTGSLELNFRATQV